MDQVEDLSPCLGVVLCCRGTFDTGICCFTEYYCVSHVNSGVEWF